MGAEQHQCRALDLQRAALGNGIFTDKFPGKLESLWFNPAELTDLNLQAGYLDQVVLLRNLPGNLQNTFGNTYFVYGGLLYSLAVLQHLILMHLMVFARQLELIQVTHP